MRNRPQLPHTATRIDPPPLFLSALSALGLRIRPEEGNARHALRHPLLRLRGRRRLLDQGAGRRGHRQLDVVQERLARDGRLGPVARLMPTTAATTLRKGKEAIVIDGPFAETKEQLLGFFVLDCASLEQAIETAKDLGRASSSNGSYEIRPMRLFRPGNLAR